MKGLFTFLLILSASIGFGQEIVKDSIIGDGIKKLTIKFDKDIRFDFYYPAEVEFRKVENRIIGNFNGAAISLSQVNNKAYNSTFYDILLNSKDCTEFNTKCGKLKNNYFQRTLTKKGDILEYLNSHEFLYDGGYINVTWLTEIQRNDKVLEAVNIVDELSNLLSDKAELREHYYYFYK